MTHHLPAAARPALADLLTAFDTFVGAHGLLIDADGTLCRAYLRLIKVEKAAEIRGNSEIMSVNYE